MTRSLSTAGIVAAIAAVFLVLDAGGGPGWDAASAQATLALHADRTAGSPLYDVLASVAVRIPAGEPGFRLGILGALLGALTLGGVVAAARALLPREPVAGIVGALLLIVSPSFRDGAAFGSPSMLAALGSVWAIAFVARRDRTARDVIGALGCCALILGSAPWLGAAVSIAIVVWLVRTGAPTQIVALGVATIGALAIVLWIDAIGRLPSVDLSLTSAIAASGHGAGAIVVGAGLLGASFGALTGLRCARWLAIIVAIVIAHEIVIGGAPTALLGMLAIAASIVPSAIVRVAAATAENRRRDLITIAAGLPLLLASVAIGATVRVDDPGTTPSRLAHDLVDALPPGPGVVIATRSTTWFALEYEHHVAGARADLAIAPLLPPLQSDVIAADAMRAGRVVGADAPAFGRLDVRRAMPRGRGFQLVGDLGDRALAVPPPADYPTDVGARESVVLAIERARYEAASGRLDAAARAAGLAERFGAADLAVLAATRPARTRPALFGFLPLDAVPPGPWLLQVFGDDLAWVAEIAEPSLPADAPMPRRLHATWRAIFLGTTKPDDPAIAAMGDRAVAATKTVLAELRHQ